MLKVEHITMSNNIDVDGSNNVARPILRHLKRSKTINVSQFMSNEVRHGNEVSFHDETSREKSPSPQLQPTSSCQALRHAVSALTRIDDFILEELGDGFFANVYKATHKATGEEMVMKINKDSANRPSALREVQLMNKLSHPNILRFLGVCVHEGQLHALTEYVSGGTLEGLLANKEEELPWTVRIKLSLDIAKGIHYLHNEGVFHRDLTSKNVLIKKKENKNYTAIVADFGLATKIPDPNAIEPLPPVGSPWWMAPEVIHGKFYDQRADIFSFGIILLEITTRIDADPETMPRTQKFGVDYIKVCDMVDYCPLDFLQFAFKCCQILPEKRPLTSDVMDALEKIYRNLKNDSATALGRLYKRSRSEDNIIQTSDNNNDEVFITAQFVAQAMRKDDPLYCPANANPFANIGKLKDGRKLFEIPRQRKLSSASSNGSEAGSGFRCWESFGSCVLHCGLESQSLPSSPVMLRKAAEKLHQASLHGSEAVQANISGHELHFSLSSEGYESGDHSSWDSCTTKNVSIGAEDVLSDTWEVEARRSKLGCNRTRSLGSLDFFTPPLKPRSALALMPSRISGVLNSQRNPHIIQDSERFGFCNRITSEIRESSLENLLESSSQVVSSTVYCGEGDTSCVDTAGEFASLAEGEEIMFETSDREDDLNSASTYFSVAENLPATSYQQRKLSDCLLPSGQRDCNSNNTTSSYSRHEHGDEDRVGLGECERSGRNSDGCSISSSSLSSYLSCSELGEDGEGEGDTALAPMFSSPHRPGTPPPPRPQYHGARHPFIERSLLVNSDAPVKLYQALSNTDYPEAATLTPLIAVESGSYDKDHFGKVANSNLTHKIKE
ncbi:dual specificity testis-specific protein kinase 2 [Plakobranchus ocellatus]|uniref:dual-specificity kinase n=1 Tax=Plakobranchus ocellatus TaxID=259542 RepID=A0AAV4C9B2_9GAST|nr:dual specificity testis-specific protein kinase 2 [Plakobranchus ocellatus]